MSNKPRETNLRGRRSFKFDRVAIAPRGGPNDTWCIDLVDVDTTKAPNSNEPMKAGYIFSCVDLFSRFGYTVKMENKNAESIRAALEKCHEKFKGYPNYIWSDKEGGLNDEKLKQWLDEKRIHVYHTTNSYSGINHNSVPIAESFNRTVKIHWDKIKNDNPFQTWPTVANRTAHEFPMFYNHRVHRTLGVTPQQAMFNKSLRNSVMNKQLKRAYRPAPSTKGNLKLNQAVHLQRQNDSHTGHENKARKMDNTYIDKPMKIKRIVRSNPIRYALEGRQGYYYRKQLKEGVKNLLTV